MKQLYIFLFVLLASAPTFAATNEAVCKNFAEGQKSKYLAHRSQTEPRRQALQKEYQILMDEAATVRSGRATESQKQELKSKMSSFANRAKEMKNESERFRIKMKAENQEFNSKNHCIRTRR